MTTELLTKSLKQKRRVNNPSFLDFRTPPFCFLIYNQTSFEVSFVTKLSAFVVNLSNKSQTCDFIFSASLCLNPSSFIESEIADMPDDDKAVFLSDMGMQEPGLNRLIRAGFSLLGLQTYFTAGVKEVRAWTVRIGATAPQAAGVIHTDFERGFIRAEVIAFDDFVALKGEQGAKEAGKMRLEGKDYIVKDGDVMHFRFNV